MPTRTHVALGDVIDTLPAVSGDLNGYEERDQVVRRLVVAEADGDAGLVRELTWERGILDLRLPPAGGHMHGSLTDEQYDERWGMVGPAGADAVTYVTTRVEETAHPALRVRYLEFLLWRVPSGSNGSGRRRGELHRAVASAYRAFVDHALDRMGASVPGHETRPFGEVTSTGLFIAEAVGRVGFLVGRRGALSTPDEKVEWAKWLVGVAHRLDTYGWPADEGQETADFWRHRYPFMVLDQLRSVPAEFIGEPLRTEALSLLQQSANYFAADPLYHTFSLAVTEVEANLRSHLGEADVDRFHQRRTFEAHLRAADFHREHGTGLMAAQFYRQALRFADQRRGQFGEAELDALRRDEREAIEHGLASGELVNRTHDVQIPMMDLDMTQATPEATIAYMIDGALQRLPDLDMVEQDVAAAAEQFPMQHLFPQTMLGPGKVVAEAQDDAEHLAAAREERVVLHARFVGMRNHVTLGHAAAQVGLTTEHLVAAFDPLGPKVIDEGAAALMRVGYERYFAGDLVSAVHVLVPRVEDVVRRFLRERGIEDTQFVAGLGPNRTTTRTDDATFGAFLRRTTADGRPARAILGEPLYAFVGATMTSPSGMNLRNDVAHGLARPAQCTGEAVGVVTHILLALVALAAVEPVTLSNDNAPSTA